MGTLLPLLVLGFFLGMRHATDPDHVVAVTTILAREKRISMAAAIGGLWGLGHTLTILLVGGAIVVFGIVIPPRLGLTMEFSVAVMLVLLGAINLAGIFKHVGAIAHDHHDARDARHRYATAARPLAIGVVHGLAGSAAIALVVVAAVHTAAGAIAYLAIFCVGTIAGMMLMTSAFALPLVVGKSRFANFANVESWIARGTGVVSVLFGLFMAYQVGIHDGLFSGHPVWSPH